MRIIKEIKTYNLKWSLFFLSRGRMSSPFGKSGLLIRRFLFQVHGFVFLFSIRLDEMA